MTLPANVLQGECKTLKVYWNGEPLTHHMLEAGFSWGSRNDGAYRLAFAVLAQFVGHEDANRLCSKFCHDFVSRLPQSDFRVELDVPAWIRANDRRRSRKAVQ